MNPVEEEVIRKKNYGEQFSHDPTFAGPLTKRSCTDILCFLIFFAFIGGWIFVAVVAYKSGNPERLIYPTDSNGLRCGVDEKVRDKKFLFFFNLLNCASPSVIATGCPTPQVCVEKCPEEDFSAQFYLTAKDRTKLTKLKSQLICVDDVKIESINTFTQVKDYINENKCAPWYIRSKSLAGRCLPSVLLQTTDGVINLVVSGQNFTENLISSSQVLNATKTLASLANIEEFGERFVEDMSRTWPWVIASLAEAALLSFIYIFIMRWLATPMVWISLIGSVGMLSYGIYACWERYSALLASTEDSPKPTVEDVFTGNLKSFLMVKETWLALMIISAIVLAIILLIALALRKRLRIAIALIGEASKAIGKVMTTLFFPIIPWLLQLGVLVFGISIMLYLASSGNPEYRVAGLANSTTCKCPIEYKDGSPCLPEMFKIECKQSEHLPIVPCYDAMCTFYAYKSDPKVGYYHAYNLVGLFWGLFFVSAFGEMVLAGTFSTWYWTFKKEKVPYFTLTGALWRTIRYHLGTIAFGSLIITICRLIRVFLEWLDHKLKKHAENNSFIRGIMCCCKCCFWCLEKFLRFLNRNAYIMCAVHGRNFCNSARDAFFLLMRNVVRVVVLDKVTDFLLFLGKLLILTAMLVQSYYIFSKRVDPLNPYVPNLNYYMAPVIIIGIGTYFIASVFFGVYAVAVDTLFLCFLEDSERNDGSAEKPYYMSSSLMRILNKKNKLH